MSFEGFTAADWYALSGERSFLGADQPTAPGDAEVPTGSAQGNAELGLSGVEFTDGASASAIVREAGLRLDVGRGTQDLWDVVADLSLSDLVVDDDPRVAIGEIALNSRTTDYPLARWRALADRFGLDLAGGMAAQGEQQQRELADALRGMRWGSSTAEFGLTRLAVGPAAAALVALDEGSFRFAFDGREALASIAYGVRAAGLFVADPDVPAELVPRQVGIELAIENLPPEVFILPALTALESGGNTGAISGAMLGQILMSEAPSAIVVESFDYDAAALGVSGSGRVSSDAGPGAFVGEFDVAVRDLERFEALVAAAERDGAAWVQGSISAACVAALREVGEPGPPAAKGAEPAHLYHVAVSTDGDALANGVPLAGLFERCAPPIAAGGEDWERQRYAAFDAEDAGEDAIAEARFKQALATAEQFGSADARLVDSLGDLGVFYVQRARNRDALPLLGRAAALRERAAGPDHPDLAFNLWWLGRAYAGLDRPDEAKAQYRRAIAINKLAFGPDSLDVAWDLDALAVLYSDHGRFAEAEAAFERVMAIAEAKLTAADDDLAQFLDDYAALKRATGRGAEAAEMEARAAAIRGQ